MADLIDRNAAIDAMRRLEQEDIEAYGEKIQEGFDAEPAVEALKALPSAQPEQKAGRWIHDGYDFPHGNDWIHCSVCGQRGINVPADLTRYCPNCGAKMEEGDE